MFFLQDFYLPSGINASLASIFNTPPSGTNQSNWSSASFPQHCNGVSAFLGADDRCYFSLTTETGALLLVILPSMNSDSKWSLNKSIIYLFQSNPSGSQYEQQLSMPLGNQSCFNPLLLSDL